MVLEIKDPGQAEDRGYATEQMNFNAGLPEEPAGEWARGLAEARGAAGVSQAPDLQLTHPMP